jgi:hypothetical protein
MRACVVCVLACVGYGVCISMRACGVCVSMRACVVCVSIHACVSFCEKTGVCEIIIFRKLRPM